jgi:hypothetical protein
MQKTKGYHFLLLALCAFAGLGVEALYAFLIEPAIYGAAMQEWTTGQTIIHWVLTSITWGIAAVLLLKLSNRKFGFDLSKSGERMKPWQWLCVLLCTAFMIVVSYFDWGGFKVVKEFEHNGWLKFIFQYIYYFFETVLFTLIIVFGQKACELWFKKENFPYGGIAVALTWGLGHILSKGLVATGLLSALGGFIFGVVYLLVNRDIKKTFLFLFILFVM